jgi:hypothetical protein
MLPCSETHARLNPEGSEQTVTPLPAAHVCLTADAVTLQGACLVLVQFLPADQLGGCNSRQRGAGGAPAMKSRILTVASGPLSVPKSRSVPPFFTVDSTCRPRMHRRSVHRHC